MNTVYLRLKPQYENNYLHKYIAYNHTKNKEIDNIRFYKKPYYERCVDDNMYDILSEEEGTNNSPIKPKESYFKV
jgi:hypothetical protein